MLAQSFKSAEELGITEPQLDALRKTLVLLETGELVHSAIGYVGDHGCYGEFTGHFNMNKWNVIAECGTVCCIGGQPNLSEGLSRVLLTTHQTVMCGCLCYFIRPASVVVGTTSHRLKPPLHSAVISRPAMRAGIWWWRCDRQRSTSTSRKRAAR